MGCRSRQRLKVPMCEHEIIVHMHIRALFAHVCICAVCTPVHSMCGERTQSCRHVTNTGMPACYQHRHNPAGFGAPTHNHQPQLNPPPIPVPHACNHCSPSTHV